ncbi:hypothetical protein HYX14_03395 [Candidatus Woesearchaeota archaeon]|nr:hypothetical protein [Candidatus Woesearchaeota archaeon]
MIFTTLKGIQEKVDVLAGSSKKKKPTEDKRELGKEIGDVIFTLVCLANNEGINLDEAWRKVMQKCYSRDKDRFEKKE